MSTKTLRKRIALVAVSAMGFGLLSVTSSAAAGVAGTAAAVGTPLQTVQATNAVTSTFSLTHGALATATTDTVAALITLTKPNGSAVTLANKNGDNTADDPALLVTGNNAGYLDGSSSLGAGAASATWTSTVGNADLDAGTYVNGTIGFTPDVPGTYVISVQATAANGTTAAGTAATATVIVLPSTTPPSTAAAAITATQTAPTGVVATGTTITLARATSRTATDGQILGLVTATADAADIPLNTVIGEAAGLEVGITTGGTAAAPTFAVDRTGLAAGDYTITFFVDANSSGSFDTGESTVAVTFTVTAAATAVGVSLSSATRANVDGLRTFTVTATLVADSPTVVATETTSAGVTASALNLTNVAASTTLTRVGTTNTYVGTFIVDESPTGDYQDTYITVHVGTLGATGTIKGTATLRVVTLGALAATDAITASDAVGVGAYTAAGVRDDLSADAGDTATITVDPAVASITFTGAGNVADAGEYVLVTVTPGSATTCVAASATLVPILADFSFTATVAGTCAADAEYTVAFTGTNTASAEITFEDPSPTWTVAPGSYKNIYGSTNTLTATLMDQFARPLASKAVTAVVTGRNPSTTALTTNASGQVTWTSTDASTSTLLLTDSVVFNYNYTNSLATNSAAPSTAVVITYAATAVAVGSVVTVDDETGAAPNSIVIDQVGSAATRAQAANTVRYTATVKTAAGAPVVAGVLVTFAGGADDMFYAGNVGVTDAFGKAYVDVYRTKTGYASITATAGGVTSLPTSEVEWVNNDDSARYITLSPAMSLVAGGVQTVVATVSDRWGNPVQSGVAVTFGLTGVGRLLTAAPAVTNIYGQSQIQVTSNAAELGVMTITASITGAQSTDLAGFVGGVAVAGVTAGDRDGKSTTVTFTKDTSTSTADALLALATALGTRDQASAAVDAAAEATDAANAATDAANAAAEAADAATAAAQDAADAVAALSTQVSEMVAALKKQITSLTNLVIKIQKKVRA